MTDINYLLLLTGHKSLRGAVKGSNVAQLCSAVVEDNSVQFKEDGIKVRAAELRAYSVSSDEYDDYSADRRQFSPDALNSLKPAASLTAEEFIVLIGSATSTQAVYNSLSQSLAELRTILFDQQITLRSIDQRQRDQEALQLMNSIYPTVPVSPSRQSGDINQSNWRARLIKRWNANGLVMGFPQFVRCLVSGLWLPSQLVIAGHILPYISTDSSAYQKFGVPSDPWDERGGVLFASGIEDCFGNHRVAFLRHRINQTLVFHVLEPVQTPLFNLSTYTPPAILTAVVEQHAEWASYRERYPTDHSRLLLLRFLFGDRDGTMPLVRHFHNKIVSFESSESCDRPPARRALSYHALKSFHLKHLRIDTRSPLQSASKASPLSSSPQSVSPQITSPASLTSSPQSASSVTGRSKADFKANDLEVHHNMVNMLVKLRNDRKYEEPIDLSVMKDLFTADYIQISPDVPDTLVIPSVLTDAWNIPDLDLNQ